MAATSTTTGVSNNKKDRNSVRSSLLLALCCLLSFQYGSVHTRISEPTTARMDLVAPTKCITPDGSLVNINNKKNQQQAKKAPPKQSGAVGQKKNNKNNNKKSETEEESEMDLLPMIPASDTPTVVELAPWLSTPPTISWMEKSPQQQMQQVTQTCTAAPLLKFYNKTVIHPVWVSSFPGSGSDIFHALMEAMTGIKDNPKDQECNNHPPTCKTHWPEFDSSVQIDRGDDFYPVAVMLLRNPKFAIPSWFNRIWQKNNRVPQHSKIVPEAEWIRWRARASYRSIMRWKRMLDGWHNASSSVSNKYTIAHFIPYEELIDIRTGPAWMEKIYSLLQNTGTPLISAELIPCTWYNVVKTNYKARVKANYTPSYSYDHQAFFLEHLNNVTATYANNSQLVRIMERYRHDIQTNFPLDESNLRAIHANMIRQFAQLKKNGTVVGPEMSEQIMASETSQRKVTLTETSNTSNVVSLAPWLSTPPTLEWKDKSPEQQLYEMTKKCTTMKLRKRWNKTMIHPVWVPSFPGSGADMFRTLTEAITGLKSDEVNNRGCRDNPSTCKTHWPAYDYDATIEREHFHRNAIMLVRNPRFAIPSWFNWLWEHKTRARSHSQVAPESEWIQWRGRAAYQNIMRWRNMFEGWHKTNYTMTHFVPYEEMVDIKTGPAWLEKIYALLQNTGTPLIPASELPCIWYNVVKAKSKTKRSKASYTPTYARKHQAIFLQTFANITTAFADNPQIVRIMQMYRYDIENNLPMDQSYFTARHDPNDWTAF